VSDAQNNNHRAASVDSKRIATDFIFAPLNDDGTDVEKPLRPMFSWIDYGKRKVDRTRYHIGEGFLEVGCFIFLIGPSYSGKSTLIAQLSISFALAQSCFIFKVHRSLRSMVVQAEDPENKLVKIGQMFHRMGLNQSEIKQAHENTAVLVIDDFQDSRAVSEIERHALDFKPDIIWLNPLTSYLSGGVYKEEAINKFLRVDFGPMLKRIGASGITAHHPPKPTLDTRNSTVRLRTQRTKGCGSRIARLTMVFKLGIEAQKHSRRLNGSALLPKVVTGVQFIDLLIVSETTSNSREVAISGSTGRTRDYGCGRIRHVRPNKSPEVIYAHFGCQCYASDCLFAKGLFTSL